MMNIPITETIELNDIEQVKLMNRIDTKYWFHASSFMPFLNAIKDDYLILEIEGESLLSYATTYFDTEKDSFYTAHHNGKLNRIKVRHRSYLDSGISFLEVKRKNNKGRTIKKRIQVGNNARLLEANEMAFVDENTPFLFQELHPAIQNYFKRITLVSKTFDERCTIDLDLRFQVPDRQVALHDLVIVEVKSDGRRERSPLMLALLHMGIRKAGFSKYCIGRVLTDSGIKLNAFKPKLRRLYKALHNRQLIVEDVGMESNAIAV